MFSKKNEIDITGGKKKKRKGISSYTVMLIPDTTDSSEAFQISFDTIVRWVIGILALIAIAVCLVISMFLKSHRSVYGSGGFIDQITALEEENKALREKLENLPPLEETTAADEVEKKDPVKKVRTDVPGVLPIDGTATIVTDPFEDADEHEYRLVFMTLSDSYIIATADGKVSKITSDGVMSDTVIIDHNNGYRSVYGFDAELLINEGDEVKQGEKIAYSGDKDFLVCYEIFYGGDPVDPAGIDDSEE